MPYDAAFNVRRSGSPHMAVHTAGHRYLFNRGYRADTPFYSVIWRWDEGKDVIAVPVAIIGNYHDMFSDDKEGLFDKSADRVAILKAREGAGANGFVWSDRNSDQQVTADEFQFYAIPGDKLQYGGVAGSYIKDDLSFAAWHINGGMVPAPIIDAKGVPQWDLKKVTPLGILAMTTMYHQSQTPVLGTDFNVFGAMGWEYFSNPQG